MLARLQDAVRPTLSKAVWGTLVLCVAGVLWTEEANRQTKVERKVRGAIESHNMDVAMGHWRDSIGTMIKQSGVCQLRGHFCSTDSSASNWYWHRESIRGPDVVDVILPRLYEKRPPRAQLTVFLRDKAGDVGTLLPEVRKVVDAIIAHLQVSPAAAAACKAARSPTVISDGPLKLGCERRIPAYYQNRLVQDVEGSSWTISVENLP